MSAFAALSPGATRTGFAVPVPWLEWEGEETTHVALLYRPDGTLRVVVG